MIEINTLQELIEFCASGHGIPTNIYWAGDSRGTLWLVVMVESGQYWFDSDGNVMQVL
jgi:hypothetical protein